MELLRIIFVACVIPIVTGFSYANSDATKRFVIERENESQYKVRSALMNTLSGPSLQGQPLARVLSPVSIKKLFVPYESVNQSQRFDMSDDAIRSLFDRCTLISQAEFIRNSLAPWKTLIVTTDRGEEIKMELMLGADLGEIKFENGSSVPFKCVR